VSENQKNGPIEDSNAEAEAPPSNPKRRIIDILYEEFVKKAQGLVDQNSDFMVGLTEERESILEIVSAGKDGIKEQIDQLLKAADEEEEHVIRRIDEAAQKAIAREELAVRNATVEAVTHGSRQAALAALGGTLDEMERAYHKLVEKVNELKELVDATHRRLNIKWWVLLASGAGTLIIVTTLCVFLGLQFYERSPYLAGAAKDTMEMGQALEKAWPRLDQHARDTIFVPREATKPQQ
jgi:hypothetical protein